MVDFFSQISYHNTNRTPRTSHASDVSHGETFLFLGRKWLNNTDKAEESCGIERMPKAYGVKQPSFKNFEYPRPYEKLKICHPTQKVRLLENGDIVISSLHSDGKIRVYLVNK